RGTPKGPDPKAFNTAFLTDPRGVVLARYHKQVLLAFGEYIPFSGLLGLLPGVPLIEGFTAGDGPRTLDLPGGEKIAPLICYEDLMPEISRSFVREKKANLLVNLTNDAWYGRTVAPWQHARLAQWRAIETRRSLLRVTNTGVTSFINAKGEMVETLPIFTPAVLKTQLEILEGETFYVRFGDCAGRRSFTFRTSPDGSQFLLTRLYAPVETGDAAPRFLAVLDDALPFLFVGNERPVLFAVGGDLQLVGVRVGKINASFSRSAESVFGARVALVGAAHGRNQFQHTIEIVLAYVESDVHRATMPSCAVRQRRYRLNTEQLVIGKLEKSFVVIFVH